MPTLRILEAEFIQYRKAIADENHGRLMPDGTRQWGGFEIDEMLIVEKLEDAQGILFLCPLCFQQNNGSVGTHTVQVTFDGRGVESGQGTHNSAGKATRWRVDAGTGLDDLQLSPSILLEFGCGWHGFVGHAGVAPGHAQ